MKSRDGASGARPGFGSHSRGRRSFLAAAGSAVAGLAGVAGCLGSSDRVRVLAAGSLAVVLEEHVGPAFEAARDVSYGGEYHGSNAVMRMLEEGTKHSDVVVSADAQLLRDRLYPRQADWDVTVAANEVGIAYAPETDLGARLEGDEPWYEAFADADAGDVAISDPDLDPLGYRAVHLFELAERVEGLEGFRDAMLERVARVPDEPQLLTGVESGTRACAVTYRNMALDHDLPFRSLPDAYNFASPDHASQYAEATYTTDEGRTIEGRSAVYNATVVTDADAPEYGREFVSFLVDRPALLEEHGLRVGGSLPRLHGAAPEAIEP